MEIDTKHAAIQSRLRLFLLTLGLIVILTILLGGGIIENKLLGLDPTYWSFIAGVIYICILIYYHVLDIHYIYFSNEEGNKLIFRFYSLRLLNHNHNSIEIPKDKFIKYEISYSFFNLKKKLILYQRMNKGMAKYPPINITSLSNTELSNLQASLSKVIESS